VARIAKTNVQIRIREILLIDIFRYNYNNVHYYRVAGVVVVRIFLSRLIRHFRFFSRRTTTDMISTFAIHWQVTRARFYFALSWKLSKPIQNIVQFGHVSLNNSCIIPSIRKISGRVAGTLVKQF